MGGCRCSFYKCNNNTTLAKETNSIHSHFFHFPIRDMARCKSWAIYSNNMSFLSLPVDKLKNKVICDMHFPESSFMNYTRSKLNKTTAIPTIFISPETNQEVDLLSSPTDWVINNKNAEIQSQFNDSSTSKIDMDSSSISTETPPAKKIKTEIPQKIGEVRILNKLVTPQANKIMSVIPKSLPTSVKVIKTPVKSEQKSPNYHLKTIEKPKLVPSTQISFNDSEPPETYEFVTVLSADEPQTSTPDASIASQQVSNDEIKSLLSQASQDISEIKSMLGTKMLEAKTAVKSEAANITQSQFNKVQLFNGIKRYLSPSLIALLRMELFSGPNREYKKDEKIICAELLKLGDETYDFFNDEWRLRLPAKEQVISWQNEEMTDDDAC